MLAKIDSGRKRERIAAKGKGRRDCAKGRMREKRDISEKIPAKWRMIEAAVKRTRIRIRMKWMKCARFVNEK